MFERAKTILIEKEFRKIIHLDMDCFYAAVETKYRPELRGKPVAIGGPPNTRSVLCTANYEARRFNVKAAMPTSRALRLCPELILVPPQFELYKKESQAVRKIMARFTDMIEPLSLDEAYLDVTYCELFHGSATLIAQEIRRLIFEELQLTASAGVAPNKFLAKVASDWKKPNGCFMIHPRDIDRFMLTLPVDRIYGVGKVTAARLRELGMDTCGDIQRQEPWKMKKWFGTRGLELLELSFGRDNRVVEPRSERKSISVEETFSSDLLHFSQWMEMLPKLYRDWEIRVKKANLVDRVSGLVVKVKYFDFLCSTHEIRSSQWPQANDFEKLFFDLWKKRQAPCRLLGLGARLGTVSNKDCLSSQLSFDLD